MSKMLFGKISAQPDTTLWIQFLDRENNDKNNTSLLGKQICFTIVWGCAEILPVISAVSGNEAERLLSYLNSVEPSIQFTLEHEKDSPFLI